MPLVRIDLHEGHTEAELGREDWSFGDGVARYAVPDRAAAGS